jgi:hypothetical protein
MTAPSDPFSVDPALAAIEIPSQQFNPTIHKMSQEDALEQVALLREANFANVGQTELHSGIHPTYGRCIVMISDASASIIPFA